MNIGVVLLAVIASAAAREAITVDPDAGGKGTVTDLSGTGLTKKYCVNDGKECAGNTVEANFAGTEFQCQARCSRRRDCFSAFFANNKVCHIRSERCAANELTPADGKNFYRLKEGESCPAGRPPYEKPPDVFGNSFCMMWGYYCKGDSYFLKPVNMATFEECLVKCARIKTCSMANYDHVNKKCEPLLSSCADEALVKNPNIQNFQRLAKDVTECSDNRVPPAVTPPPPTQPPPTEPPPKPLPPVTTSKANCGGRKYRTNVYVARGQLEVTAECGGGCVMTVCNCAPWAHCDGARFTPDGKCRVSRRTRNGRILKGRKKVRAHIKCEPMSRKATQYISTTEPDVQLRCGAGWDRRGDCTFYARGRSKKQLSFRIKRRSCMVSRHCRFVGECMATAVCVRRL